MLAHSIFFLLAAELIFLYEFWTINYLGIQGRHLIFGRFDHTIRHLLVPPFNTSGHILKLHYGVKGNGIYFNCAPNKEVNSGCVHWELFGKSHSCWFNASIETNKPFLILNLYIYVSLLEKCSILLYCFL